MSMNSNTPSIGELISAFFAEYLAIYGDRELAAVATAATINELLEEQRHSTTPAAKAA
jgi:hypothetical protein